MKNFIKIFIVLIFSLSQLSFGQFNKAGRTAMQFLKIGNGSRQVAMGEAAIAGVQDVNSIFWNPAAITGIQNAEAAFNYNHWIADLKVLSGAVGYNLDGIATFAVDYISLDYGDIAEALTTSSSGGVDTRTGTFFSGSDVMMGFGIAKQFTDKLSIGIHVKYIQEKLYVYSSSLWGFDVGSFYNTGWRGVRIAMSAQNFSTQARFLHTQQEEQQTYEIPLVYRIGVSMDLMGGQDLFLGGDPDQHKITFNVDAVHTNDYKERLMLGLEYKVFNIFSLRGGYKLNYDEGNLSFGAGVDYVIEGVRVNFDYAYVSYDFLESPNRFTVSLGF
ncbi:MAG TPA: PorV/PorQ family protein [Ignavibacteriaceae bacterium]|nr:PorV/PorQ family protein [Ignavibacteriaceae bacterium]